MTRKEVRKLRGGQWVRVVFDDVGARDGVLLQKWNKEDSGVKVFFPFDDHVSTVDDPAQIIGRGRRLTTQHSGL